MASFIGDRKGFGEEKMEGVEEILMDSIKAQSVVEAARVSMGGHYNINCRVGIYTTARRTTCTVQVFLYMYLYNYYSIGCTILNLGDFCF